MYGGGGILERWERGNLTEGEGGILYRRRKWRECMVVVVQASGPD